MGEPRNTAAYGGKTQALDGREWRPADPLWGQQCRPPKALSPIRRPPPKALSPIRRHTQGAPITCDGRGEIERKQALLDIVGKRRDPGLIQDQHVHHAVCDPGEETYETRSDQETRPTT